MADVLAAREVGGANYRQTAPEYSQTAYHSMLEREYSIGNYLADRHKRDTLQIERVDREAMVALMQELHSIKKYNEETLFLACSIADRFLAKLLEKR